MDDDLDVLNGGKRSRHLDAVAGMRDALARLVVEVSGMCSAEGVFALTGVAIYPGFVVDVCALMTPTGIIGAQAAVTNPR